jgi:hypothetical protein
MFLFQSMNASGLCGLEIIPLSNTTFAVRNLAPQQKLQKKGKK